MTPIGPECQYQGEHPRINAVLESHEQRISRLEEEAREDRRDLWLALGRLEKTVEHTRGWIAGAMIAATLLGGIIAFIAVRVLGAG